MVDIERYLWGKVEVECYEINNRKERWLKSWFDPDLLGITGDDHLKLSALHQPHLTYRANGPFFMPSSPNNFRKRAFSWQFRQTYWAKGAFSLQIPSIISSEKRFFVSASRNILNWRSFFIPTSSSIFREMRFLYQLRLTYWIKGAFLYQPHLSFSVKSAILCQSWITYWGERAF